MLLAKVALSFMSCVVFFTSLEAWLLEGIGSFAIQALDIDKNPPKRRQGWSWVKVARRETIELLYIRSLGVHLIYIAKPAELLKRRFHSPHLSEKIGHITHFKTEAISKRSDGNLL